MSHPYRILDPRAPGAEFRGRCAFTVMAKAPVPGKVKTRLSPPLTPEEAATLNAAFLRDTIENLAAAGHSAAADVVVSYTPVGEEERFLGILPPGTLLLPQRGDGFGERLLTTAEDLFRCGYTSVCLIDSDSPTVPSREFAAAAGALLAPGSRCVLGPSADGGYYLIGLQTAEPVLFERISWSTAAVAAETLERARECGVDVAMLGEWYDVDDRETLARLIAELEGEGPQGYAAPHTREQLPILKAAIGHEPALAGKNT